MCVTLGPRLLRGRLPVAEEVGVGRKMILLLGWLTRGVQLAAGAAQARRDVVKRYGCQVGYARERASEARLS